MQHNKISTTETMCKCRRKLLKRQTFLGNKVLEQVRNAIDITMAIYGIGYENQCCIVIKLNRLKEF
jgi:hypothetical protein